MGEALRAGRRKIFRLRLRDGRPRADFAALEVAAEAAGVPVVRVASDELRAGLDEGVRTQGAVLEAGPLPEVTLTDLLAGQQDGPRWIVALDGVEDPQNLGAIARTAYAAGVRGLILPHRRSAPLSPAASRASAGALEWLPAAREPNLPRALKLMKSKNFWTIGADPNEGDDLFRAPGRALEGDVVLVLGGEGRGLRPGVANELDHRLRIPMRGRVESLNVSAAAAVLLFELVRRSELATPP